MASVEAAINLVVRGQQRVDRLLQSLDQVEAAVEGISREPLKFDLKEPERQLEEFTQKIQTSAQNLKKALQQARDKAVVPKGFEKIATTFIKNQDIINKLEERGATSTKAYTEAVGRRDRALDAIGKKQAEYDKALQDVVKIEKQIEVQTEKNNKALEERTKKLMAQARAMKIADNLARSYIETNFSERRRSGNLEEISKQFSLGGVRSEIRLFDQLASSVNVNSDTFKKFTIASQAASQKLGEFSRLRIRVLAEAFSPTVATGINAIPAEQISKTRKAVEDLLLASQSPVRSEAGLSLMIDQLQQLRALIPFVDANYGKLTQRITELNEELNRGTGRPDPAQRRINAELSRQADIESRINEANLTIGQQETVRSRLAEARVALEERGVEAAQEQTRGLTRQINAMQSLNRAQERRNSAVEDELSLLEGRIGRIQRSDLPDDIKTILTSRGNQAIDLLAGGPGIDPDLEGARRVRRELERDRIAAEKDYRSTLTLDEARSSQIGKILKLEQDLNKIRLSGVDTTAKETDLGRIRNALTSNTVQLNKQLISDTSIALDRVADYVTQQRDGIRVTNEQAKNTEKQNKANQDLITKGNTLKVIQHDYNKLKAKGVSIGETEAELSDTISRIDSGQYEANEKSIEQLNTLIKKYASFVALKRRDLDENRLGPATRLGGGEQLIEQQRYERELEARGEAEKNLRNREDRLERASGYDLFLRSQRELESAYAEMNDMGREDLKQWSEKLQLSDKLKDVQTKIDAAALSEREKKDYLLDLEKARNAASQDRLVLARAITDEIENQIKLETSSRSRSRGASFKMGPQAAPVDKITGPATTIKGREEAASQRRSAEVILENLTSLEKQGIDVSEKRASVQSIINNLRSKDLLLSNEILSKYDSQLEIAEHFLKIENKRLYNTRLQNRLDEESRKAQRPIYGMGPQAAPVDKITGPVSAVNEPEKIQDLLQRARIQQQALLGLQIKGIDVAQEQSEIQQLINELEGRSANLKGKGANLSQKLREDVERELNIGDDKIRLMNGQMNIMGQMLNLEDSFIEKRNKLNKLLLTYNELKKKGVDFQGADVELETLINSISGALGTSLTKDFIDDLGRKVKQFQSTQSRSVQEAVAAGTFTGTTQTPEKLEKERNRQLREAYGLRKTLDDLERKGIASDLTRIDLLQQINTLEQRRGQIAADNLIAVQAELETTGRVLDVTRTEIARLKSDIEETSKATGFGKSFQDFQEALKGSRAFFGTESPAEAIDKIVREFNKGVAVATAQSGGPTGLSSSAQSEVRTEAQKTLDDFRNQWANLTTNPRFFGKMLSRLPDDALTVGMAGAATDLFNRGKTTGRTLFGTGKIQGGLESQIETAYQDAFGKIPSGVTRLFDKISSLFDALVGRRYSGAGFGGGSGGLNPPAGPGGGGLADFASRVNDASATGVAALLGLQELEKPSKVSTKRLEILSAVLKDVYTNLDPMSDNAARFSKQLRETTARLDDIVASRAPDADPLVRLTRSPRLAQGISEGLIGGAFPLLFGQGGGAALGGGLGGFAGGFMGGALGFGLSLIGTAVGTALDTLSTNIQNLGKSLNEPTAALEAMETAGLRVTPVVRDVVTRLEELGLAGTAQAVVLEELRKQLGADSVNSIIALTNEQKLLEAEWQRLMATIATTVLPGLVGTTSLMKDLASAVNALASMKPPSWWTEAESRVAAGIKGMTGLDFFRASDFRFGPGLAPVVRGVRLRAEEAKQRAEGQGPPELTPERRRQEALSGFRARLEFLNAQLENSKQFSDQIKQAAREQEDLDRQRYDLIADYEKSIEGIRLGVERQIEQERLAALAKENEILSAQGDVRLQQLRNTNAELKQSLFGNQIGEQLADIVSQFTEQQLSTENEIANRRRNLELELQTKDIQLNQYKMDVAKQVADLNLGTAKQIANIQLSVSRKNQDYDRKRFDIEKQIARLNMAIRRTEAEQKIQEFDTQLSLVQDPQSRANLQTVIDSYRGIISLAQRSEGEIKSLQPPAPISFAAPAALSASVSTSGIDSIAARGAALVRQLEQVRSQLDNLVEDGNIIEINASFQRLADQGVKELSNQYEDLIARLGEDPIASAKARIDSAFETVAESRSIKESSTRAGLERLIFLYKDMAKANLELGASLEFFNSRAADQLDQVESLKQEFNLLITGTTEYEKTIADLTSRGIKPASEEFKILVKNASEMDRLNEKIAVVNGFRTAATELTTSLRGLVEQFFEVGSASEAVKNFSEELSKKSLGFVLDLAFKPVEDAMQKTMLDMATALGFDITPESQKQLQEIATIRASVQSIEKQIASMFTGTVKLVDLPDGRQGIAFGDRGVNLDNASTNSFSRQAFTTLFDHMKNTGAVNQFNERSSYLQLYDIFKQKNPNFSFSNTVQPGITPKTNVPASQQVDAPVPGSFRPVLDPKDYGRQYVEYQRQMLEYRRQLQNYNSPGMTIKYPPLSPGSNKYGIDYSLPHEKTNRGADSWPLQNRTIRGPQGGSYDQMPLIVPINGIGGPDLGTREPYPVPQEQWMNDAGLSPPIDRVDEGGVLVPGSPTLIRAKEELKRTTEAIEKVGNSAAQAIPQLQGWDLTTKGFMGSVDETTVHFEDATQRMSTIVPQWGKSLGQVVTGIGMASTAIIGIVGGIQNIRKGGAGNIFSGIGSILTTVGGLGMSIAGMGLFRGGGSGAFPTGNFNFLQGSSPLPASFGFANGGVFEGDILDSPKLFNFEDAGVTKSGQAGEAGTEAIMPLSRTKDGRLGVSAELSIPFEMTDLIAEDDPEGADPEFTGASASSAGGRGAAGAAGALSVPFSRMGRRGSGMTAAQAMRAAAELGLSIPFVSNGDTAQAETTAGGADEVIRFESTVINGQEFVTREEAEKIGRVAAVKGADLARRRIRNNPQERRLQGIQ